MNRLIIIDTPGFKAILSLDIIPISSAIRLRYSLYQFKGNSISQSVFQSIEANPHNVKLLQVLPVDLVHSHDISINECEKLKVNLDTVYKYSIQSNKCYEVVLPSCKLFLDPTSIFTLNAFIEQFIRNYEQVRYQYINAANLHTQNNKSQQVQEAQETNGTFIAYPPENTATKEEQQLVENEIQEQHSEIQITYDSDSAYIEDILTLCPNSIFKYYLSKMLIRYKNNTPKFERLIRNQISNGKLEVSYRPLFYEHTFLTVPNLQSSFFNILVSFNASTDEYLFILRKSVGMMINILQLPENEFKHEAIAVKILDFIVYCYTLKLAPKYTTGYLNPIEVNHFDIMRNNYLDLINYSVKTVIGNYMDITKLPFNDIQIMHSLPNNDTFFTDVDQDLEFIESILPKEKYLIDIDHKGFIERVFNKTAEMKKDSSDDLKENISVKNPTVINIDNVVNSQIKSNTWIEYELIHPQHKQLKDYTIITPEYHDVLLIINSPSTELASQIKGLDPIIKRYIDVIIKILEHIKQHDLEFLTSTMYILNNCIRIYLNPDVQPKTELFILYRIVLPHLYDSIQMNVFLDYFN